MRLGATSSAVISAACHPYHEDGRAFLFPVRWGTIPSGVSSLPVECQDHVRRLSSQVIDEHGHGELDLAELDAVNIEGSVPAIDPAGAITYDEVEAGSKEASFLGTLANSRALIPVGHCCFTTADNVELPVADSTHMYG